MNWNLHLSVYRVDLFTIFVTNYYAGYMYLKENPTPLHKSISKLNQKGQGICTVDKIIHMLVSDV